MTGTNEFHCPNCGSASSTACLSAPDFDHGSPSYTLVRCSECKVIRTLEATADAVSAAYARGYYASGRAKFNLLIEQSLLLGQSMRARKVLRLWAQQHGPDEQCEVLDLGCGRGSLLAAFARLGAEVLGLERREFPIDDTNQRFIEIGALRDPTYQSRCFDIIIIWHVLEHMDQPDEELQEAVRHLKPGGLLVIAVPNYSSTQRRVFKHHWFHLDVPRHLYHFERNWLINRLEHHRLRVIRVDTFDLTQNLYGFIQSALNGLIPGRSNRFYDLLKHDARQTGLIPLCGWTLATSILLPFAIIESIIASFSGSGATLALYARKHEHD